MKPEFFKLATFNKDLAATQLEQQGCEIHLAADLADQEQTLFVYARAFCEQATDWEVSAKPYLLFLFKEAIGSEHASWEYISGIALLLRWVKEPAQ